MAAKATHLCLQCLSEVKPKKITPGSFALELALWLLFLLPGLIYSISRLSRRYQGCPVCAAATVVPLNSPAALRMRDVPAPPPAARDAA